MRRSVRSLERMPTRWRKWLFLISLVLVAWGLRLAFIEAVPPGWRDDELINTFALSGELLDGRFPVYFTGASGHEPLYHYLQAGVSALAGYVSASGHMLSVVLGTLSIVLAYVLVHRLFGFPAAALTSFGLTFSFWSLMYSRIALRHISLLPFALAALYCLWTPLKPQKGGVSPSEAGSWRASLRWAIPLGFALGISLYTYPASRLLPILLAGFALYLALLHRDVFWRAWRGYALALAVMALLALPLAYAIVQGSSDAAAQGIGADARLVELAQPVRALREGDPGPLLENVRITLSMFHATGDPEALYNIPNRPMFGLVGGVLFWAGVLLSLIRWRQPRHFLLLLWLALGLLPTVLSIPPASLSHSILVQPLAFLFPALTLIEGYQLLERRLGGALSFPARAALTTIVLVFLFLAAVRDVRDYFVRWPNDSYVRFLYRADYRGVARYIDQRPETKDWAVASLLMGPWDRLALDVDTQRDDIAIRLFDPQRAMVYLGGAQAPNVVVTTYPPLAPVLDAVVNKEAHSNVSFRQLTLEPYTFSGQEAALAQFTNGLRLDGAMWVDDPSGQQTREIALITGWTVAEELQLPSVPVVANPPPPGVYSGPRLAAFAHLLTYDGEFVVGDDGLWVDPVTLRPGDHFIQLHRFTLPPNAPDGPYVANLGLYDPFTGERWLALDGDDQAIGDSVRFPAGVRGP
jgi:4-amino-4-deoxy-L-arabinose transferase-like glycosyltransferase